MTRSRTTGHLSRARRAFTLIELLVACVVLMILLGIILTITGHAGMTISRATVHLDAFAAARSAFDTVTKRLGQATLNPYYEYLDSQGHPPSDPFYSTQTTTPFVPVRYGRQSDLQFVVNQNAQNHGYGQEVYFASPLGYTVGLDAQATPGLLNVCSFFVQYVSDQTFLPATMTAAHGRYRLMQAIQPTEKFEMFQDVALANQDWFAQDANALSKISRYASPLADNVLVLTVWPRLSEQDDPAGNQLTTNYTYDSHPPSKPDDTGQAVTVNQLPPVVQVTMVVLSKASAEKLSGTANKSPEAIDATLVNANGDSKFTVSTVMQQRSDLADLSASLVKLHADFEIFTTAVPMREARWGIQTPP